MARWQIVVKTSEATKQTKDQNDNNKKPKNKTKPTTTKRAEGAGVEKQITKRVSVLEVKGYTVQFMKSQAPTIFIHQYVPKAENHMICNS